MNERIEALAKQAAEYAIEFAVKDQELYIPKLMEKFAELIVRECANIDFRFKVGMTTDQESDTSRVILDHFGVK